MPIIKSLSEASGSYASAWCERVWGGRCWCGQGMYRAGGMLVLVLTRKAQGRWHLHAHQQESVNKHQAAMHASGVNGWGLAGGVDKEGKGKVASSCPSARVC